MVPPEAPYPDVYTDTFIFFLRSLGKIIWMNVHYFPNAPRICDGTDVQADWRRSWSCTYGRAPNAIDISQGSLTCPSYTDTGPTLLYVDFNTPPHLVAFYDTLWIRRTFSRTPGALTGAWFIQRSERSFRINGKIFSEMQTLSWLSLLSRYKVFRSWD